MTELRWSWIDAEGYITIPDDNAKWGKGKTIRLPIGLLREIEQHRGQSPFVWAGYVEQLRGYHRTEGQGRSAHKIKDFAPERLRGVFQKRIAEWAAEAGADGLSHHAFRRTGLQWSREGQLRSTEGDDAKAVNVSQGVADKHSTARPQRLWADLTDRNIASEIARDRELAVFLGFVQAGDSLTPAASVEAVQAALGRGDFEEAGRLLAQLKGESVTRAR